ncbi:MAG: hypothetical protein AB8I08_08585 [Sandaracinaceae bacterium]
MNVFRDALTLGELLDRLTRGFGGYDLLHHWTQGEFHHDVVLEIPPDSALSARFLVVATNCNGGVKEVLSFSEPPARDALWHWRCPEVPDFEPLALPEVRAVLRTVHFFDPCELLTEDARSELRPEHRKRQRGGGWIAIEDEGG